MRVLPKIPPLKSDSSEVGQSIVYELSDVVKQIFLYLPYDDRIFNFGKVPIR